MAFYSRPWFWILIISVILILIGVIGYESTRPTIPWWVWLSLFFGFILLPVAAIVGYLGHHDQTIAFVPDNTVVTPGTTSKVVPVKRQVTRNVPVQQTITRNVPVQQTITRNVPVTTDTYDNYLISTTTEQVPLTQAQQLAQMRQLQQLTQMQQARAVPAQVVLDQTRILPPPAVATQGTRVLPVAAPATRVLSVGPNPSQIVQPQIASIQQPQIVASQIATNSEAYYTPVSAISPISAGTPPIRYLQSTSV